MMEAFRTVGVLVCKDLRIEAKSRQTGGLVAVLGLLVVVVLGLGLGLEGGGAGQWASAVLWVAYLFSGVLCFEKTMAVERADGALGALLMAPVDRGLLYLSKLISNLALIAGVAAVVTPAGMLFFGFDLSAAPMRFGVIMALGVVGFAAIGTLFSAVVSSTRLQGGLLALAVFPLALPLVITSTQLVLKVFRDPGIAWGGDCAILVAFDAVFLVVGWVLFEWVLEP